MTEHANVQLYRTYHAQDIWRTDKRWQIYKQRRSKFYTSNDACLQIDVLKVLAL